MSAPTRLLDADDITGYVNIIAVDPGGATGWAVFSIQPEPFADPEQFRILDNIQYWDCGTFVGDEMSMVDELTELAEMWPDAALVCEDFELRQRHVELSPLSVRSAWARDMYRAGRPVFLQKAEPMKRMAGGDTHPRLKEWNLWRAAAEVGAPPGSTHHRDATAHGVLFARRCAGNGGVGRRLRDAAWPFLFPFDERKR